MVIRLKLRVPVRTFVLTLTILVCLENDCCAKEVGDG